MKRKAAVIGILLICCVLVYQQCSVGGSDAGIANLGSQTDSGPFIPTSDFDSSSITLSSTSTSFTAAGVCDAGPYTNHGFFISFTENGATSPVGKSYTSKCVNKRFSFSVQYTDHNIQQNKNGVLRIRVVATSGNQTIEGRVGVANIGWGTTPGARCGDSTCNGSETCSSCSGDCGVCPPICSDGTCNGNETCSTCPGDCGACPPACGDGTCNGTETCDSCPGDCGACWIGHRVCRNGSPAASCNYIAHGNGFTQANCDSACRANGANCCEWHATSGECNTNICGTVLLDSTFPDANWFARKY